MNLKRMHFVTGFLVWAMTPGLFAAQKAVVQAAAYSGDFLVETVREITISDVARRTVVKTQGKGTVGQEANVSGIHIERLDLGQQMFIDPKAKTYSESSFMASGLDHKVSSSNSRKDAPLLVSRITPKVTGPNGTAKINGIDCQSYSIRVDVDFSDAKTKAVVATETLLEKLWVSENAPNVWMFQKVQTSFDDALYAKFGTEEINLRWLLREFNLQLLDLHGDPKDFDRIQQAYRSARLSIKGVTVRQLAAWTWKAQGDLATVGQEQMPVFIASLAAGLGAPPETGNQKPLAAKDRPRWVQDLQAELGQTGPMAMLMKEVRQASVVEDSPKLFEVPETYKRLAP